MIRHQIPLKDSKMTEQSLVFMKVNCLYTSVH